jgi:hypothetical protein
MAIVVLCLLLSQQHLTFQLLLEQLPLLPSELEPFQSELA